MKMNYFISIIIFALLLGGCSLGLVNKEPPQKLASPTSITSSLVLDFGNGEISTSSATGSKTAFDALEKTAREKNLEIKANNNYDFGVLVEGIGSFTNNSSKSWLYYVNGQMPSVAADKYELKQGDIIEWKYEEPNF